jgi:hypothetical protein
MQKTKIVWVAVALLSAGLAWALAGGLGARGSSPEATREFEVWIEPGTYTGFALCSTANVGTRRWVVRLVSRDQTFPIVVAPGETTVIPFPSGWNVTVEDKAHFVSRNVPFGDMSDWDALAGEQAMIIGAWGMSTKGPVMLHPPP